MAKVLNPLNSTQAKGSVGGLTYTQWRGQNIVRATGTPVRRHEGEQPDNRALLGFLSRQWGLLSDAERTLWNQYADEHPYPDGFGGTFKLSGIQMYCALNHNAVRLGGGVAKQDEPPLIDPAASLSVFTAETGIGVAGDVDVSWTTLGVGSADDFVELWISPPSGSPGLVNVDNRMKYAHKVEGSAVTDTIGSLVVGAWYWFKGRYIDQYGQKTAWHWDQATPYAGV